MKNRYITATLQLLNEGHSIGEVLSGLARVLKVRDHESLYGTVLRGVLRRLEAETKEGTRVYLARASDVEKFTEQIDMHLATLNGAPEWRTIIDPSLIGGVIVSSNYKRIDTTYKRALTSLYQKVTE